MGDASGARLYKVLVNREEQYSIAGTDEQIPDGWRAAGKTGTREACLAFIKEVWLDMRPLSLRRELGEDGGGRGSPS